MDAHSERKTAAYQLERFPVRCKLPWCAHSSDGGAGGIRTHDIRRVPRLRVSSRAPEFPHSSILVGLPHVMDSGARPNAELTTFLERSPGPVSSLARLRPRMGPAMSSCPVPHQIGQGEILVIKPSRGIDATSRSSANLGV